MSAVIIAECGDLRRFNTEGQFTRFVGIVPGMYNSGGGEKCLGITTRSRSQLLSDYWHYSELNIALFYLQL